MNTRQLIVALKKADPSGMRIVDVSFGNIQILSKMLPCGGRAIVAEIEVEDA